MAKLPLSQQIHILLKALETLPEDKATPEKLEEILKWVADLPPATRPPELIRLIVSVFHVEEEALRKRLMPPRDRDDFDTYVPSGGWLHSYVEYTRQTEPPTVFHFFAGLVALGAAVARNVSFNKGAYHVFPNLCVVIVAPSGKCRKTSACNVSVGLLRAIGGTIVADKVTPEALIEAFKDKAAATGLLYAPELAVFLGKQKYQEGMVPMLTSLFDCPSEWSSATVMRGEAKLTNVALSFLGCSTMDWIQTAIPRDAFGGGFMSRLLFVVQEDTPRQFAIPPPLELEKKSALIKRLIELTRLRGEFKMDEAAVSWYKEWYRTRSGNGADQKQFAGYYERKPDHLLRIAMTLSLSEGDNLVLDIRLLKKALLILNWVESYLPATFEQMSMTIVGEDSSRLLGQLRKNNGALPFAKFLRMNSHKMDSDKFRKSLETLKQAGMVEYDTSTRQYYLTPDGWKGDRV